MTKSDSTRIKPSNQVKKTPYGFGYNSKGAYKSCTVEYRVWRSMMVRCYCPKEHKKRPKYKDCIVCDDWQDFQVFAEWYVNHKYYDIGYQLDKDILKRGNKIYSPETCCLVPGRINNLILDCEASRGLYPIGVDLKRGKFRAQIRKYGRKVDLGYFESAESAHEAYVAEKTSYVRDVANKYKDAICDRTYQSLIHWKY